MKCACLVMTLAFLPEVTSATSLPKNHPIIGTWRTTGMCPETYEFRADGTRSASSATETLQSKFTISIHPSPKGYYKLLDTVVQTNGQPDCSGQLTPVGDVARVYIHFSEPSQFVLCYSESQRDCAGPFLRVPQAAP